MRGPLIRVSQAAAVELKRQAEAKGVTVVAVVDALLLNLSPAQAAPPPPIVTPVLKGIARVGRRLVAHEPICGRCGHPVRKHTPACYQIGCACRRVQA